MQGRTIMELLRLSPVMPIIFFCSILFVAVLIERTMYHLSAGKVKKKYIKQVMHLLKKNDYKGAFDLSERSKMLISEVVKEGIKHFNLSRMDAEIAMASVKERVHELLRKRLIVFGTLSFISPLMGLLGTVLGIMTAFQDVAVSGSGGPTIIAAGVSEALTTTVAGIAVAVPAAIIYNYFTTRTQHVISETELLIDDMLLLQYGKKQKMREKKNAEKV